MYNREVESEASKMVSVQETISKLKELRYGVLSYFGRVQNYL